MGSETSCGAVLLERVPSELLTHSLLTCGSRPDYAVARQTVESCSGRDDRGGQSSQRQWEKHQWKWKLTPCTVTQARRAKERRSRTRAKESTKVKKRAARIVVRVASGGHKEKYCRYKNTIAEVGRIPRDSRKLFVSKSLRIVSQRNALEIAWVPSGDNTNVQTRLRLSLELSELLGTLENFSSGEVRDSPLSPLLRWEGLRTCKSALLISLCFS